MRKRIGFFLSFVLLCCAAWFIRPAAQEAFDKEQCITGADAELVEQ